MSIKKLVLSVLLIKCLAVNALHAQVTDLELDVNPLLPSNVSAETGFWGGIGTTLFDMQNYYIPSTEVRSQLKNSLAILAVENARQDRSNLLPWFRADVSIDIENLTPVNQNLLIQLADGSDAKDGVIDVSVIDSDPDYSELQRENIFDAGNVIFSAVIKLLSSETMPSEEIELRSILYPDSLLSLALLEQYPTTRGQLARQKREEARQKMLGGVGTGLQLLGLFKSLTSFPFSPSFMVGEFIFEAGTGLGNYADSYKHSVFVNDSHARPGVEIPYADIKFNSLQNLLLLSQQAQLVYDVNDRLISHSEHLPWSHDDRDQLANHARSFLAKYETQFELDCYALSRQIAGMQAAGEFSKALQIMATLIVHLDDSQLFKVVLEKFKDESFVKEIISKEDESLQREAKKEIGYLVTLLTTMSEMHDQLAQSETIKAKITQLHADALENNGSDSSLELVRFDLTSSMSKFLVRKLIDAMNKRFSKLKYENFDQETFINRANETKETWLNNFESAFISNSLSDVKSATLTPMFEFLNSVPDAAASAAGAVGEAALRATGRAAWWGVKKACKQIIK